LAKVAKLSLSNPGSRAKMSKIPVMSLWFEDDRVLLEDESMLGDAPL
jgi:hypothetical protein